MLETEVPVCVYLTLSILARLAKTKKFLQTRVALYYVWSFTWLPWTCILPWLNDVLSANNLLFWSPKSQSERYRFSNKIKCQLD